MVPIHQKMFYNMVENSIRRCHAMDNDPTPSPRKSGDRPERFVELTNDLLFHMVFAMSEKAR